MAAFLPACLLSESDEPCSPTSEENAHACRELRARVAIDGGADGGTPLGDVSLPDIGEIPAPLCADVDLGRRTSDVYYGRSGSARDLGCAGGPTRTLSWTPPRTQVWTIDTNGSDFDTILGVRIGNSCESGRENFSCDDDSGEGRGSSLSLELPGGIPVLIVVQGYSGAEGSIQLNIR